MDGQQGTNGHDCPHGIAVPAGENLPAMIAGALVEPSMGAIWTGNRLKEVIGGIVRQRFAFKLTAIAGTCKITINDAWRDIDSARIALTVGNPIQVCRRGWTAAK